MKTSIGRASRQAKTIRRMSRVVLLLAALASLPFVVACGGDDGDPGDDAFPSCDPLVLTDPGPFSMSIDKVQSGPLPFKKWTGSLYMTLLPNGVGFDPDAGTYVGTPTVIGSFPVTAYTAQTNGCTSDTVRLTINVVDAPANCTDATDCTDPALPVCNDRKHCITSN